MYDKMNLTSMNVCESGLIDLNDAAILGKTFQVEIDDDFFSQYNGLITKGKVEAEVVCDKINANRFHFEFHSFGVVSTPCDRCLDDVELRIDVNNELYVAMADEDNDEGNDGEIEHPLGERRKTTVVDMGEQHDSYAGGHNETQMATEDVHGCRIEVNDGGEADGAVNSHQRYSRKEEEYHPEGFVTCQYVQFATHVIECVNA